MKFKLCGGLDCPDWILAEIASLSSISAIKVKQLAIEVTLDKRINIEKEKCRRPNCCSAVVVVHPPVVRVRRQQPWWALSAGSWGPRLPTAWITPPSTLSCCSWELRRSTPGPCLECSGSRAGPSSASPLSQLWGWAVWSVLTGESSYLPGEQHIFTPGHHI